MSAAERINATGPFLELKCRHCNEAFGRGIDVKICPECHSPHHSTCWSFAGGCATCRATPKRACWCCGKQTRASVSRCDNCGAPHLESVDDKGGAKGRAKSGSRSAESPLQNPVTKPTIVLAAIGLTVWIALLVSACGA